VRENLFRFAGSVSERREIKEKHTHTKCGQENMGEKNKNPKFWFLNLLSTLS
jgi:hypothetical protein